MSVVATAERPQCMRALDHANEVRLARTAIRRGVAVGAVNVADVILNPPDCTLTMTLAELLGAQRRWGVQRSGATGAQDGRLADRTSARRARGDARGPTREGRRMTSIEKRCCCGAGIIVRYTAPDDYSVRAKRESADRERQDCGKYLASWDRAHKGCAAATTPAAKQAEATRTPA